MPAWILKILINIAISVGVPAIVKYFPGIPKEVIDIIEKLIEGLKEASGPEKRELKKSAKECIGVACKANLKRQ